MLGLGLDFYSAQLANKSLLQKLLQSGDAVDLIAQAEAAATITNTRTGIRLSPTSGAEIAANTVDYYSIGASGAALRGVNVMATATILISNDLATWGVGPSSTLVDQGNEVYLFTSNATSNSYILDSAALINGETFTYTLVYSEETDATQQIWIRGNTGNPVKIQLDGTTVDSGAFSSVTAGLTTLTGGQKQLSITATVNDAGITTVDFFGVVDATIGFSVKFHGDYFRATKTTSAMAAFPRGSSAAATYASDDITITGVAYPSDALLIIGTAAYHWSGTSNPETTSPRYFDTTGSDCLVTGSVSRVNISGNADVTGQPVDSQTTILTAGWDGVNVVARYGDGAETSIASAGACSGTFTLGTGTSIVRTMHANMFAIMIDQAAANLTDAEQKQFALGLNHGNAFAWAT